ncbi:MAG: signal peptidase I [Nocardioides sp.]
MEITPHARPRRRGRGRRLAVNVLCALVTLVGIAFIVPAAFGLQRYVIAGQSMTGSYDLGSVVFEKVVPVGDLQVGDVITYLPPADSGIDHLVTHRIASIRGHELRTQGDANADPDPWTFALTGATQPRVSFGVRYVGYAFLALQNPTTRITLIGIPAGAIALFSLGELIVALRRRPSPAEPGTA